LHADKNQLESLPALPAALTVLSVKSNNLSSVPPIPNALESLHVTNNQLTLLPSLATTELESLGCGNNLLTSLPQLTITLRRLGCANNRIERIVDLPPLLRLLSCSDNPLNTLELENLKRIQTVIAANCALTFIPLLPSVELDEQNFPQNASLDQLEDRREYIFDNNPLTPQFAAIYQRYKDGLVGHQFWQAEGYYSSRRPGSTRQFREEVLQEHRRILRERGASVAALREVFKGRVPRPGVAEGPKSAAERVMEGNYGVGNIVSRFITGLPGTAEQQRLGVLQQREDLGNVPAGTAAAAKQKIANIAAHTGVLIGPATAAENYLQKRAKLYLKSENIAAAKQRFLDTLDAKLERLDLEDRKKKALRAFGKLHNELKMSSLASRLALLQFGQSLSANIKEDTDAHLIKLNEPLWMFSELFASSDTPINAMFVIDIRNKTLGKDVGILEATKIDITEKLWGSLVDKLRDTRDEIPSLETGIAQYPQFYTEEGIVRFKSKLDEIVRQTIEHLFGDGDIEYLQNIQAELRDEFLPKTEAEPGNNSEGDAEAVAAVNAVLEAAENEDGEALPIAMAAAQGEDFLAGDVNNNDGVGAGNNNNQGGGKRRHRVTPRNRKNKRVTRKQK
jgi:hypothetical protein